MSLQPAPGQGPIFVMGAMGTGTTLLRLVLDSHDAIAVPPETGFMRAYKAHKFIPFKWTGRNWAKRLGWSDEELDEELRQFYNRLFMRYVETHGKRRWGEKTPLHIWHWDAMARVFPDAVFVAIVRHPGGSMASNINRWRFGLNRAATHFERYTREMLRQAAAYADRTVMLRYEELLLQPEPVLRELLAWLGEDWSDSVLEHHKVQADRGGREVVEGRNKVSDPLDVSRISKWTNTIKPSGQRQLDKRVGRLAEFLGYSMLDPAVLEPINPRDAPLTSGDELRARIDEFSDLDLKARGNVPRFERLYHPREFTLKAVDTLPRERKSEEDEGIRIPPSQRLLMRIPRPVRASLGRARRRVVGVDER
jgi:hypothetical protein